MSHILNIPVLGVVLKFAGAVVCHTVSLPPQVLGDIATWTKKALTVLGVCS